MKTKEQIHDEHRQKAIKSWPAAWSLDEIVYCSKCGSPVNYTSASHDAGYHIEGCPDISYVEEDFS